MESSLPKPLVPVRGKPIIAHQFDYLLPKVSRIVVSLGYRAREVTEYISSSYPSSSIYFSVETEPLGTAGALKLAFKKTINEWSLVLNCDDLTDINISLLERISENTICVCHPRLPFGRVIEQNGYAVFEEKPVLPDWVSCGWYVLNKAQLALPRKGSMEYDVFPTIKLRMYKHEGFWKPLNTQKDISEFEALGRDFSQERTTSF